MIGFGNPLLDGPDRRYAKLAQLAREKQSCPATAWERIAGLFGGNGGVALAEMRSGLAMSPRSASRRRFRRRPMSSAPSRAISAPMSARCGSARAQPSAR